MTGIFAHEEPDGGGTIYMKLSRVSEIQSTSTNLHVWYVNIFYMFIISQECFPHIICVLHYEVLMGFFSQLNAVCKCHQNVISSKLKVAMQWKLV